MKLARSNCQNQPFAVQKAASQEAVRGVSGLMPLAHLQVGPGTPGGSSRERDIGTMSHGRQILGDPQLIRERSPLLTVLKR